MHCTTLAYVDQMIATAEAAIPGIPMRRKGMRSVSANGADGITARDVERDLAMRRLMQAAQEGNRLAYDTLLRECLPIIRRMARRNGIADELLEDVVQEVLLTVHQARHTYDPSRSFTVWVSMIAQRRSADVLRRQYRRMGKEIYSPTEYEAYPEQSAGGSEDSLEEHARVQRAIASLPDAQRDAVERLGLKEQTLKEASLQTGRTTTALKVNFHRALKVLRDRMSRNETDD